MSLELLYSAQRELRPPHRVRLVRQNEGDGYSAGGYGNRYEVAAKRGWRAPNCLDQHPDLRDRLQIMQMALGRSSPDYTWCIDISGLPVTNVDRRSRGLGCFLVFFSLLWGGFPTVAFVLSIISGKFEPGMLPMLIFTVIGSALFVTGLNQLFGSRTTTIDERGMISVAKKSLFGTSQWAERLSSFEGVLSRSEYHPGSKNSPAYTLYIVELKHPDRKKTVKLYESKSDVAFRIAWEDYCRKLGLPALEMDGSKVLKRDVEDLNKTARDLVKEGKLKVEFDPSRPPPRELVLRVDGDVLELTTVRKTASLLWAPLFLAVPAVFMYVGFRVKDAPAALGVVGSVFFAIVLGAVISSFLTRQRIRIGRDQIETCQLTPWGETEEESISASEIETVRIGNQEGRKGNSVLLESDGGAVEIGAGLSAKSLEWLKNCIMRVISV